MQNHTFTILFALGLDLVIVAPESPAAGASNQVQKGEMGGVAPNFSEWANGPGAGKGRDWDQPKGKYGVAQLSPWLLWPPDGLELKQLNK